MKRYILVLLLLLVAVVLPASAQTNPEVLVWSLIGGDITTLNTALITDGNSFAVAGFLFDGLYKVNPDTGLPEPQLATWDVSEDGLTYTFHIKPDAKWSDGEPITAQDVKFTYDAINSDIVQSPRKADFASIVSVEATDDATVVVTLKEPNCTIWGNGFGSLTPLPSHKFAADLSDFMTNPFNTAPDVVSGPYKFVEWKASELVRLEANPEYHRGAPEISSVVFRIVADQATLGQALGTSTVDYGFMYPDDFAQIQNTDPITTFNYPNPNAPIVIFNEQDSANPQNAYDADGNLVELTPNKFFSDVRVRQAFAMGYDKAALAQTQGPDSVQLSGPIVPSFYGAYDMSSVAPWSYDPEAAGALLDEAGWVMGADGVREKDGVKFEVDLVYSKLVDLWGNAALIMQDQMGQIGVKINIVEQEWSAYLSNTLLAGKYDLTVVGFGGGTEVDGIAYNLLHSKQVVVGGGGFNLASYVNPKMDELLDTARTLPGCDVAARAELYKQMQQIARDDVPYDWLVSTTAVNVLNKRVTDAYIGQWGYDSIGWGLSS